MKYVCLIYADAAMMDAMSKSGMHALIDEHLAYNDELRNSGHFVSAEALQPAPDATIVRIRNGKISVTDGPFAETKEQLGGFFLIEARDLNEAIQVASKIPSARIGAIEIRAIQELIKR